MTESKKPAKKKPHPWRTYQPGMFASKTADQRPYQTPALYPKGLTKMNRAR